MINLIISDFSGKSIFVRGITNLQISMQNKNNHSNVVNSNWSKYNNSSGMNDLRIKYIGVFDGVYHNLYDMFAKTCKYEFEINCNNVLSRIITSDCNVQQSDYDFQCGELVKFKSTIISSGEPQIYTRQLNSEKS